jgi:hypothetical protein
MFGQQVVTTYSSASCVAGSCTFDVSLVILPTGQSCADFAPSTDGGSDGSAESEGEADAAFDGVWLCPIDDAGDALTFAVETTNSGLTETLYLPHGPASFGVTCTEQFTVSGSTATLIPAQTQCMLPPGTQLEGVPAFESQTVNGNTLTLTGDDEGAPLQTLTCTRQ